MRIEDSASHLGGRGVVTDHPKAFVIQYSFILAEADSTN